MVADYTCTWDEKAILEKNIPPWLASSFLGIVSWRWEIPLNFEIGPIQNFEKICIFFT